MGTGTSFVGSVHGSACGVHPTGRTPGRGAKATTSVNNDYPAHPMGKQYLQRLNCESAQDDLNRSGPDIGQRH